MTALSNTDARVAVAAKVAPVVVASAAALAVRTPLATAYPLAALLIFGWIVCDTLMLSRIARMGGSTARRDVLAVLAGASLTIALAVPPPLRRELLAMPILAMTMGVLVVTHLATGAWHARRAYVRSGGGRTHRWVSACSEILPPALVRLTAAEMAILHMALFRWGGPPDVPAGARGFAYHRHLTPIGATLLGLSTIEIAVYHLLVGHWNRTAAIVMFVVSDIGFVYLLGLIKSFRFRSILLTREGVRVRAGFLIDRRIPFDAIRAVVSDPSGAHVRDPATLNAALLAWPNVLLELDPPLPRAGLFRRRPPIARVAFRLDDPAPFVRMVRWRLGQRPT